MRISAWSSDVCSSYLRVPGPHFALVPGCAEIALVHEKLLRTPLSAEGQARIAARQGEHSALDLEFRCADVVVREHSVFECRPNRRPPAEIPALDVHPALRLRQPPGPPVPDAPGYRERSAPQIGDCTRTSFLQIQPPAHLP